MSFKEKKGLGHLPAHNESKRREIGEKCKGRLMFTG